MSAGSDPSARILLLGDVNPYGKSTGTQRRLGATARGLSRVGDVDYLEWGSRPWRRRLPRTVRRQAWPPLRNHVVVRSRRVPDRLRRTQRALMAWRPDVLLRSERRPAAVANAPLPSPRLIETAIGDRDVFDLVWCFELSSAIVALQIGARPMVVDLDAVPYLDRDPADDDRFARGDRSAWSRWIEIVAERSRYVTLSNPVEAAHLALPNGVVIPNGCDVPPYRGPGPLGTPPVFVFVGWMGYEANADAARYLALDIVPALRARLGDEFLVRIVGSAPRDIQALGSDPNVEVTGYVADLDAVLAGADVALVPVRRGAGTRIKVLEAFAAQLPVVSTAFGAQGLSLVDGDHLLLADTPDEFAAACARLLTDAAQRQRVIANGYDLVAANHAWPLIEAQIAELADDAITHATA